MNTTTDRAWTSIETTVILRMAVAPWPRARPATARMSAIAAAAGRRADARNSAPSAWPSLQNGSAVALRSTPG